MRDLINLIETHTPKHIKLSDIYTEKELWDEDEAIYHFVNEDDFDKDFEVQQMSAEQAKNLKTIKGDMTAFDAFMEFADEDQQSIVQYKIENFDPNRIVVVSGDHLIDGNHHVMAAISLGKPIYYIDVQ